jgi:hypothetical protein
MAFIAALPIANGDKDHRLAMERVKARHRLAD